MSNSASKRQCSIKRMLNAGETDWNIVNEFWTGPTRYGNKRKPEAKMKVKARKSDRMKNKHAEFDFED